MTALYELTNQYLALSQLADDPDMPPQALADSLEGIEGAIEVKAQALLQVVAGWEADAAAVDIEIKRLLARKQVLLARGNSLRDYLRENMLRTGIDKISCPLFSITLAKSRPMVVITDESAIPDRYVETKVVKQPIKADILSALKAGEDVPGCALGESKRALLIK